MSHQVKDLAELLRRYVPVRDAILGFLGPEGLASFRQVCPEWRAMAEACPGWSAVTGTTLHHAAERDWSQVTKILLSMGVDINQTIIGDQTPLDLALEGGNTATVHVLLEAGANPKHLALHLAAYNGYTGVVQALLAHGVDAGITSVFFRSALHSAATWGHMGVVQVLLDHNVNAGALDKYGKTALHHAAYMGHTGVVQALLVHGVNAGATDNNGKTALDYAWCPEVLALLRGK